MNITDLKKETAKKAVSLRLEKSLIEQIKAKLRETNLSLIIKYLIIKELEQ